MKEKEKETIEKVANREALIGIGLAMFNFVWWFGFAYGFGSKDPAEYTYVFGFPTWFFYSCVIGFIVMVVLLVIVIRKYFVDVPLEEEESRKS